MNGFMATKSGWKFFRKIICRKELAMSERERIEAYAMEHGEDAASVMEEFMDYLSEMEEEDYE